MNCTDWNEKLHDRLDGALSATDTAALDAHLAACPACRAEFASLSALRAATQNLSRELTPARDLWPDIEAKVAPAHVKRVSFRRPVLWPIAASVAVLLGVAALWKRSNPAPDTTGWLVTALAGAPRVDAKSFQGAARFHVGQWLETDPAARAKVAVGNLGEVSLEPNSRLRLIAVADTDHRVELERGKLSALIWAPPRLFFVNTPSATAVDLGCAYTLDVADNGDGTLQVTSGYVALEHDGRETVIPAGQMCATRRGAGPGTPFVVDASAALRRALDRFDFEKSNNALPEILTQARAEDGVTLWHLLTRASANDRGAVYDRLARDHAPPPGVTRTGVIAGDAEMIAHWGSELGLMNFFPTKKKAE